MCRFDSSINALIHFHVCAIDGACFRREPGENKSNPSNCNWVSRNLPVVVVGKRCPGAGQPAKVACGFQSQLSDS